MCFMHVLVSLVWHVLLGPSSLRNSQDTLGHSSHITSSVKPSLILCVFSLFLCTHCTVISVPSYDLQQPFGVTVDFHYFVFMFYKVAWFTHNLVLCIFLFKNVLFFSMYCGCIYIESTVSSIISHAEWNSPNPCLPCNRHHSVFFTYVR